MKKDDKSIKSNQETIVDRILKIADFKEISLAKFSRKIGVSSSYFSKQKANSANVGSQVLNKITEVYPEINIYWVLTGKGEMLLVSEQENIEYKRLEKMYEVLCVNILEINKNTQALLLSNKK